MISLGLPPDLIRRVDEYAAEFGQTRTEAIRMLLDAGLLTSWHIEPVPGYGK